MDTSYNKSICSNSNLVRLGEWTHDSVNQDSGYADVFRTLIQAMRDSNLSIEVEYVDEECGANLHYRETGVISSNGETFTYSVIEYIELPPKQY